MTFEYWFKNICEVTEHVEEFKKCWEEALRNAPKNTIHNSDLTKCKTCEHYRNFCVRNQCNRNKDGALRKNAKR